MTSKPKVIRLADRDGAHKGGEYLPGKREKLPSIGRSGRGARQKEFLWAFVENARRAHEEGGSAGAFDELAAQKEALSRIEDLLRPDKRYKLWASMAPTSCSPDPADDDVEFAAVLDLPEVQRIMRALRSAPMGRPSCRTFAAAAVCYVAWNRHTPVLREGIRDLSRPDSKRAWAFDYPRPTGEKAAYKTIGAMLRRNSPDICRHAALNLARKVGEAVDERGKPLHPDFGRRLATDGTAVEACAPQRWLNPEAAGRLIERGLANATLRSYESEKSEAARSGTTSHHSKRTWRGYKLVSIVDMATGLPLVWALAPASGDERQVTLSLLEELFALWPDCPAEVLVGDALFDGSIEFCHEVQFRYHLHPVFPPAGEYAKTIPHGKTLGTPHCEHGAMKLDSADGFLTRRRFKTKPLPRGEWMPRPSDARLRWTCAEKICDGEVVTRPDDDARVYTYYPRRGKHKRSDERQVLLARRLIIESLFGALKGAGMAGRGGAKMMWGGDVEAEWILSLRLLFFIARRVIHNDGSYQRFWNEANACNLHEPLTAERPTTGPTPEQVAENRRARAGAARDEKAGCAAA